MCNLTSPKQTGNAIPTYLFTVYANKTIDICPIKSNVIKQVFDGSIEIAITVAANSPVEHMIHMIYMSQKCLAHINIKQLTQNKIICSI